MTPTRRSGTSNDDTRVIKIDRPRVARMAAEERQRMADATRNGVDMPRRRNSNRTTLETDDAFASNVVVSAKYSVWNFVPRVLAAQMQKPSNVYFLFIAVLQSIKDVSNTNGVPTILLPLTIVFICSAIKEALEDRERHRADDITNSRPVLALNASGVWETRQWGDIQVGDIVKVLSDQTVPADLFMLSVEEKHEDEEENALLAQLTATSSEEKKAGGLAYIETKSLDGETNLKIRTAVPLIDALCRSTSDLGGLRGRIECEAPNNRISSFEGNCSVYVVTEAAQRLGLTNAPTSEQQRLQITTRADGSVSVCVPMTAKQMLLRSCVLRNTRSITGLVIFTGHETKVFCSNTESVVKTSSVEQRLNALIIGVVLIQQLVCFIGALLGALWMITKGNTYWYLDSGHVSGEVASFPFHELMKLHLRYFIIMQNFVPISLNVSLEFVKYWQAYFMEQDLEMYDEASDTPAMVRSSGLNEDLGRVHHIFTDKTGTLTMNLMLFRFCMIGGTHYGGEIREDEIEASETSKTGGSDAAQDPLRFVEFDPTSLFADLAENGRQAELIRTFLRHLALCHTLIPAKSFSEMCAAPIPEYSASSPDEQALVAAAAYCNVRFVHRTPSHMVILEPGCPNPVVYKILNVLEFDSDRKRMSIIIESPSGEVELLCKGADNVILERLAPSEHQQCSIDEVFAQLSKYAKCGMRTLCIAHKNIDRSDYTEWNQRYTNAHGSMEELVKKRQGLANAIDPLMNEVEQDLLLLGVTAVQDKLQAGVPKTLQLLQQTNMKVWTLTGDKMETAVNIGYACSMLSNDMSVKQLCSEDYVSTSKALQEILSKLGEPLVVSDSPGTPTNKLRTRGSRSRSGPLQQVKAYVQGLFGKTPKRKRKQRTRRKKERLEMVGSASRSPGDRQGLYASVPSLYEDEFADTEHEEEEDSSLLGGAQLTSRRNRKPIALVLDGATLECAMRPRLKSLFYRVTKQCQSVICCRVSPKQKADIVEFIRQQEPQSITLAIGDGANDVGMIQAAHIGVGISGQEGTQAVNASDYAISQFRFLQRLLFVHGRWAYRRVTKLMSYMLYKNVTYVLTTFWFGCFCGFSGQPLIIDIAAQSFNVIYTSLPLVLFAVFDQDVSSVSASKFPFLYSLGQDNVLLSRHVFWPWIINGVWHSVIIFFVSAWGFEGDLSITGEPVSHPSTLTTDGKNDGLVTLGFVVFTNLVIVVNLKLCLETFMLTWQFLVTVGVSVALWFVVGNIISATNSRIVQAVGEMKYIEHVPSYWLLCLLVVTLSLLRDLLWKIVRRLNFPSTYHILQEREMLSLANSPRSILREEGVSVWPPKPQQAPVIDYSRMLRQLPSFKSEQDSFMQSSPLAESLIEASHIRSRASFHATGSTGSGLWGDDSVQEYPSPEYPAGEEVGSIPIELAPSTVASVESLRHQYHGYAFSEDENVDSDVEAASSMSPTLVGRTKKHLSFSGTASSPPPKPSVAGGNRSLKKMLKSVRGPKNA
ncbi:TPA: hypothetical protein N0F65_008973 [Lagenidium giganteum]|uniref:Phospholipid-transporting ATPase n=1 Tax=Lagenidium giganteum TaxID=4803 RepID=A0AAV2YN56_9STRA|nr:TPA: hypothetical protein N0F65_008973 [Lagenidium giganteum]